MTGSMATAKAYHQQNTNQRSTLTNKPPQPGLESNSRSLHQTQGGSLLESLADDLGFELTSPR